eukprot:CAMPEP_0113952714 /NCGR_PEP_ID=MMETSP1339-20121228/90578_1 /TAXON_ID=94617 /ORGANISM="Fibrocapsa japonica" /LENGTH=404 /DNA_ID=CAMNT_0000961371 /DNA_START=64 /DNA_END=1278 /DNA_ORIENTATION=- /assembly_acc=CAM_ASM_000762
MRIEVKTLQGTTFHVEVEEKTKISQVKELIKTEKGFATECQKLIFSGRVLEDDQSIGECEIKQDNFLVCMVSKAKMSSAPAAAPASAPAPAPAPAPASAPAPAPAPAPPPEPADEPVGRPPVEAAGGDNQHGLGAGGGIEPDPALVAQLGEMGFPADQASAALRAAFNNVEAAVEFLMTGLPPAGALHEQDIPAEAETQGGAGGPMDVASINLLPPELLAAAMGDEGDGEEEGDDNPLGFLRFHPQFRQLQELVQQDPSTLQQVLMTLGQQSPELLQVVNQYPEEFVQLLNEPPAAEDEAAQLGSMGSLDPNQMESVLRHIMQAEGLDPSAMRAEAEAEEEGRAGQPGGEAGGAPMLVDLTEDETQAVGRLQALGFDYETALEAFLACEKNELMAANFLFENNG